MEKAIKEFGVFLFFNVPPLTRNWRLPPREKRAPLILSDTAGSLSLQNKHSAAFHVACPQSESSVRPAWLVNQSFSTFRVVFPMRIDVGRNFPGCGSPPE